MSLYKIKNSKLKQIRKVEFEYERELQKLTEDNRKDLERYIKSLKEFKEMITNYDILSLNDIGFTEDIVEDGNSFEENALIKARAIVKEAGAIGLVDDSGLEIDYLDKAIK